MNQAANAVNFDYQREAQATCSNQFHGELVPAKHFQAVCVDVIRSVTALDRIKKALFYGREIPHINLNGHGLSHGLGSRFDAEDPARGELLIHAIVGKVTEAAELLELLTHVLFDGQAFDDVHFMEEIGDGFWYDAIGLNAIRATFNDVQRQNIAKLRTRFPEKFTEYYANNRDLFAERATLEAKADKTNCAHPHSKYEACFAPNCETAIQDAQIVSSIDLKPLETPLPRLENWFYVGNVLIGDVIGHPRLGDAKDVRTSFVVEMNEAEGYARTRNTVYKLGKKAEGDEVTGGFLHT